MWRGESRGMPVERHGIRSTAVGTPVEEQRWTGNSGWATVEWRRWRLYKTTGCTRSYMCCLYMRFKFKCVSWDHLGSCCPYVGVKLSDRNGPLKVKRRIYY